VEALLAELRAPAGEDRVAWRHGVRHVERLVRLAAPALSGDAWRPRPRATYVVTGGFGDLGLLVAQWLVERGAREVALIGRHAPSAAAAGRIAALQAAGARVWTACADVSDGPALGRAWSEMTASLPPVAGVVHAAGTLDDALLPHLDGDRVARVLAPKVEGAWRLHELTRTQALDFFVLFSSTASVLGNAGQANHAAANAFLDGLAHFRRAQGLPASSINWGAWAEIGAAARGSVREQFRSRGIDTIPPAAGLRLLAHLLAADPVQAMVAPVQWSTFLAQPGAPARFLADLAAGIAARSAPPAAPAAGDAVRARWQAAAPAARRALLVDFVRGLAARAVGAAPADVGAEVALNRIGLDSLMAVEMRHALQRELGIDVASVTLLRGITVRELAGHIDERLAHVSATDTAMVEGEL
jgi:NAD(P)-dependent dehydrogenase (short-subunit alcohol dehydrogenase family)